METAGMKPKQARPTLLKLELFWEKPNASKLQPDWSSWLGHFENWLALQEAQRPGAQKFLPAIHCRSLFQHLGSEARRRLSEFFANNLPDVLDTDPALLRTVLYTIFAGKMDLHVARFCFFSRKQSSTETSAEFLSALRTIAMDCEFGGIGEEMVVVQFQTGLRHHQRKTSDCHSSAKSVFPVEQNVNVGAESTLVFETSRSCMSSAVQTE